jgi:hypothetical protein
VAGPSEKVPPRLLPLLYLGAAHLSLALAFLFAAIWPHAVAGFFYHPWLVGLVHLVTLGWISFSIVGAMYIVGPLALRMDLPARRADYVAYGAAVVGLVGMVGHFWIQEYGGMAWSAGTVAAGILYMTVRIAAAVRKAKIQPAVRLHVVLACANFWGAAGFGLLIAIDKAAHFLPGYVIANVFAHAHLAAVGWATMMVVGVAYRMLPMTFPAKMPPARSMFASAVLLEIGVIGLFVTLLIRSALALAFGFAIVGGLAAFASRVVWMTRHPVPKPAAAPPVDFAILHAGGAAVSLILASAVGIALLLRPASALTLHAAAVYGVLGLIGFLAQMVVAMETRLIPMVTWFWTYAASGYRAAPPSPHAMRQRRLQAIVFAGWTIGVPVLACGMFLESGLLVRVGTSALFIAVVLAAADHALVIRTIRAAR